jgi:hypothetical protein
MSSAIEPMPGSMELISVPQVPHRWNGLIAGTIGQRLLLLDMVENRVFPRTASGISFPAI